MLAICAIGLFSAGCSAKPLGSDDAGTGEAGAPLVPDAAGVQGADCAKDNASGITLCTAISLCPSLVVDHDTYPHCGFRVNGQAIDLECFCDTGIVCPIGTATTCTQAKSLLGAQNEVSVCSQVAEGRCTGGSTGGGGGGGGKSTCDRNCAAGCNADPGCLTLCGC